MSRLIRCPIVFFLVVSILLPVVSIQAGEVQCISPIRTETWTGAFADPSSRGRPLLSPALSGNAIIPAPWKQAS